MRKKALIFCFLRGFLGTKRLLNSYCSFLLSMSLSGSPSYHSREEIQTHIGFKSRSHFMSNVLKQLLEADALKTTANSKSKHIKYIATSKID